MPNKTTVKKENGDSQGASAKPKDSMQAPEKGHVGKDKGDAEPGSGQH